MREPLQDRIDEFGRGSGENPEPSMWWTPEGERVLRGAEWSLFREGLSTLWDEIEMSVDDDEPGTTGISPFDKLGKPERLALLALAARGLHDEDEPCPDLTALSEAAIAAVFYQIRYLIEVEIEAEGERLPSVSGHWPDQVRQLLLAAAREVNPEWGPRLPGDGNDDMEEWLDLIDSLLDRILWEDRDFLVGDALLDADPALSRTLKDQLGIPEDYFTAIPMDPTPEGLRRIRATLRRICGRPGAWGADHFGA